MCTQHIYFVQTQPTSKQFVETNTLDIQESFKKKKSRENSKNAMFRVLEKK